MFTGIISSLGKILEINFDKNKQKDINLKISTSFSKNSVKIGDSVCCNGICLTVIAIEKTSIMCFEASQETSGITTIDSWLVGNLINMEQSLTLNDLVGGHLIMGHVDGISSLLDLKNVASSYKMVFSKPNGLENYIAKKGSIAINGVSLTVNEVSKNSFEINIISHTYKETNFGGIKIGDQVNIEVDIISRYAANAMKNYMESNKNDE